MDRVYPIAAFLWKFCGKILPGDFEQAEGAICPGSIGLGGHGILVLHLEFQSATACLIRIDIAMYPLHGLHRGGNKES